MTRRQLRAVPDEDETISAQRIMDRALEPFELAPEDRAAVTGISFPEDGTIWVDFTRPVAALGKPDDELWGVHQYRFPREGN